MEQNDIDTLIERKAKEFYNSKHEELIQCFKQCKAVADVACSAEYSNNAIKQLVDLLEEKDVTFVGTSKSTFYQTIPHSLIFVGDEKRFADYLKLRASFMSDKIDWSGVKELAGKTADQETWSEAELLLVLGLYRDTQFGGEYSFKNLEEKIGAWLEEVAPTLSIEVGFDDIYAKLCAFLLVDMNTELYGVLNNSGLAKEKRLWDQFEEATLDRSIENIRRALALEIDDEALFDEADEDEASSEGRVRYRLHRYFERNQAVVNKKKMQAIQGGNLSCEACGFDFEEKYGDLGKGYIEAHHIIPISDYARFAKNETELDDLRLVCSNCHRMLHRQPDMTIEKLAAVIQANAAND